MESQNDWQQYEFEYLLPQWTKELLDKVHINSKNFYQAESRKSKQFKLTREQSIKLGNTSFSLIDLGKDVLVIVFSYLTYQDLISLCNVNKLWNVQSSHITTNQIRL